MLSWKSTMCYTWCLRIWGSRFKKKKKKKKKCHRWVYIWFRFRICTSWNFYTNFQDHFFSKQTKTFSGGFKSYFEYEPACPQLDLGSIRIDFEMLNSLKFVDYVGWKWLLHGCFPSALMSVLFVLFASSILNIIFPFLLLSYRFVIKEETSGMSWFGIYSTYRSGRKKGVLSLSICLAIYIYTHIYIDVYACMYAPNSSDWQTSILNKFQEVGDYFLPNSSNSFINNNAFLNYLC